MGPQQRSAAWGLEFSAPLPQPSCVHTLNTKFKFDPSFILIMLTHLLNEASLIRYSLATPPAKKLPAKPANPEITLPAAVNLILSKHNVRLSKLLSSPRNHKEIS